MVTTNLQPVIAHSSSYINQLLGAPELNLNIGSNGQPCQSSTNGNYCINYYRPMVTIVSTIFDHYQPLLVIDSY